MEKKKLVIAGCGKLGNIVADAVVGGLLDGYELVGAYSRSREKAEALALKVNERNGHCMVTDTFDQLLDMKPDFLVEAASPAAMREWALPALGNGTSVVTLSIGAFADDAFLRRGKQSGK